jgi:hypothetical protein
MTAEPQPIVIPGHDPLNPDPWHALLLDTSLFMQDAPRAALMRNNALWCRRFFLPVLRPLARLSIALVQLVRILIPNKLTSSKGLHGMICWGMRNFVDKDANYLICRHFRIGSQILRFLNDNIAGGALPSHPLLPKSIEDLRPNVFVQHDINIYNFIIAMNAYIRARGKNIEPMPLDKINFSAIEEVDQNLPDMPDSWHNVLDLQSAIEFYTPMFGVFLSDNDFWRASNSLQLDETIAIYTARLFNREVILSLVNNHHPMVPMSTFEAGFRLMLHGLDAENLYGFICHMKAEAERGVKIPAQV